jgi:hypothetical protein
MEASLFVLRCSYSPSAHLTLSIYDLIYERDLNLIQYLDAVGLVDTQRKYKMATQVKAGLSICAIFWTWR